MIGTITMIVMYTCKGITMVTILLVNVHVARCKLSNKSVYV